MAAGAGLLGHQARPGGHLAAVAEVAGITDSRHDGTGGDRPDAIEGAQPLRRFAMPCMLADVECAALHQRLQLGTVRHLMSPNQFHYEHIGEWARAFPETIAWASPRVRYRARARRVEIDFARDLDASAPHEWREAIDQLLFPGGYFKEFIFFHKASRSLILTDTVINIELDKVSEPWRTATKLTGMYHPYGQVFFDMRLPLLFQQRKAKAAIGKIHSWQPQRIVLSHGRCFDEDADKVIQRIFRAPPQ